MKIVVPAMFEIILIPFEIPHNTVEIFKMNEIIKNMKPNATNPNPKYIFFIYDPLSVFNNYKIAGKTEEDKLKKYFLLMSFFIIR